MSQTNCEVRTLKSHPLLKLVNSYLIDSAQPSNLSYLWNFGSLLAFCLAIQIVTGVTLAMHYNPSVLEAFNSVEHIMRDVNNGWLIRYLHSNTASAFFFLVYLHIGRGLYYGSYKAPRTLVWTIGTVIFITMMATAFLGYVLPYGQMSLWGATVITNLMSAIPWVGQDIVEFIWGGFSVNNATLNRFFSLHFVLPFVIAALVLMHLIALHDSAGSSNPMGVAGNYDRLAFAPYFIFKDLITIFLFILILSVFVFFMPNVLGDSENYVMANPMQTPPAIVPEWYLLPFYAILRSIPNKLLGVIAMFAAILALLTLPFTDLSRSRGLQFRPLSKIAFYIFLGNFFILMQLGAKHVESPFIEFGQITTIIYFAYFLIIIPMFTLFENTLMELPASNSMDDFNSEKGNIFNLLRFPEGALISAFFDFRIRFNYKSKSIDEVKFRALMAGIGTGYTLIFILHIILPLELLDFIDKQLVTPKLWGSYFQDTGLSDMDVFLYLVFILFSVVFILASIVERYSYKIVLITYKCFNLVRSAKAFKPLSSCLGQEFVLVVTLAAFIYLTSPLISFPELENCDAPRPWGLYFQDSATPQMEGLVELHDNILFYLVIILFGVGWILASIVKNYSYKVAPISHKYLNHGTLIELIWTITPALILILIAFPSFKLLYLMDEISDPAMSVLAEGHQWYWSYQYPDFLNNDEEFIEFDSYLVPESDLEDGALRMLEVDNRVILPELTHVRFIVTAADVIHSFACPALGIKCDAYPGRLSQVSVLINREGTFYGQCSEICGILHSSMPIVIQAVSIEKFLAWLEDQ